MCDYETKKGENTLNAYDKEDKNTREIMVSDDSENVSPLEGSFIIYEFGTNIFQSTYKWECTILISIKDVSMILFWLRLVPNCEKLRTGSSGLQKQI